MTNSEQRSTPSVRGSQLLLAVLASLAGFQSAMADTGTWYPDSNFAQVNVACTRRYVCAPSNDVLHDSNTKVVPTAPSLAWGVCSAGDGPADSCNVCLTNPPSNACEWHLEPK